MLVTQHYRPELIGSGPYLGDMAEWMAARGMGVRVFTCRPHYPAGAVPAPYRDGRRDREHHAGVEIERIAPWLPRRRNAAGRIAAELVFFLRGTMALASGRLRRSDLVVSLCPSIFSVVLGAVANRRGGRHVAVVHDIPSGLAAGLGMVTSGMLVRAMRWAEQAALNRTDAVLVLSDSMRRRLRDQGVKKPIEVLPVWVDTEIIRPSERSDSDRPTVMYSGNFGKKQALAQVLEMAALLDRRGLDAEIVLRGEGSEARTLKAEVVARGIGNIRFASLVPADQFAESLAAGDIHLVPQDASAADFAVPSKIFAIMAAGRPFVATARPGSLLWQLSARSGAFLCVPAGDPCAFADAIERLASDPGLRRALGAAGRRYTVAYHDKAVVLDRFLEVLNRDSSRLTGDAEPAAASSDL